MTILLIFAALALAFTASFWGVTLLMQGYLYSQPVDRLPLRSLACGLVIAGFLTFWTNLNTNASHKDKYGTFFEFNPASIAEVNEFEAVRRTKQKEEVQVFYRWEPNAGGGEFVDVQSREPFKLNSTDFLTVALLVPLSADDPATKTRFDAAMDGTTYLRDGGSGPVVFQQVGGSRTISTDNLHHMLVPNSGAFAAALLLNAFHFLLWFLIFWPGLRYTTGHSLALTAMFGLSTMLILMPLLFNSNMPK